MSVRPLPCPHCAKQHWPWTDDPCVCVDAAAIRAREEAGRLYVLFEVARMCRYADAEGLPLRVEHMMLDVPEYDPRTGEPDARGRPMAVDLSDLYELVDE